MLLLITTTNNLLPKGIDTLDPFLIFNSELYVKHCLNGSETATS